MIPLDDEALRAVIAGCEGVTPGPWEVYDGCSWRRIGTASRIGRDYDDCAVLYPNVASDGHPDMNAGRGQDTYANLNHIARLDPDTVRALATQALEANRMREALTKVIERGDHLARCANAIAGASTADLDAEEAFDMFIRAKDAWRKEARTALHPEPSEGEKK